ncbi:MAG: hypothetical protein IJT79_05960 [Ruminococcus sp.]|nr:hypothetical protein [Ruminococcus sp.]
MKNNYTKPEIKVEELTKRDVLCASSEVPNEVENYTLLKEVWDTLTNSF